VLRLLLALTLVLPVFGADSYLFTSFRGNGETGVFLALSTDGRTWTPLNHNRPWLKPDQPGELMRDPWIGQGPDGTWHMLWTWGWTTKETAGKLHIGYASSKDLIHWSPQRGLEVMPNEPAARNLWAPEAAYDAAAKEWVIFWASTIPGRYPDTEGTGDTGYNHRIYATRTKDFVAFTPAKVWFDPGFNCIDATLTQDGKRWVMVFKDERKTPLMKRLRLAFADSPEGPWKDVTEPFSGDWVEGPSAVKIGNEWWIYFDHYGRPQFYGAMRTTDWKKFEDMSGQVHFPEGHRHGTVVKIGADVAKRLQDAHPQ
jgi:hypothetical protein